MNINILKSLMSRFFSGGIIGLLLSVTICMAADPSYTNLSSLQARPAPGWLTKGIMYQISLRSFTNEGTLKAATKRLPHVADLGATIVYLCPVFLQDDDTRLETWSPRQKASGANNPLNPYRIMDHNRIDPEYGTEADLHDFVNTAHKLGMYVLLDMVYYHCGPNSVLLKDLNNVQRNVDGSIINGAYNWPRLNFKSRELRDYLLANMEHWVKDFDVDGFRCDMAHSVPLDFWEEASEYLEPLRPDLVIMAEGERLGEQVKAFDISYGRTWYNVARKIIMNGQPAISLRQRWEKNRSERPHGARFARYTDNHDFANDMMRPDVIFSEQGAWAMSVLSFTIDGVPLIYSGQEIGDNCAHSIFTNWPIRWEAACMPKKQKTLEFYKQLCQLHRSHPALYAGEVKWVDHNQPEIVVAFKRYTENEEILTVTNLSNRKIKVRLPLENSKAFIKNMLLSNKIKTDYSYEELILEMDGFGYLVAKK